MEKKAKKAKKTFRGPGGVPMTEAEWHKWRESVEDRAQRAERLKAHFGKTEG